MLKIALGYKEVKGPWGGGNRFIRSLKNAITENKFTHTSNLKDKDIDIILLTDPRFRSPFVSFSVAQVLFYKIFINPKVKVIHRVNECDERKNTTFMNKLLINANWCSDYTVFVGTWLTKLVCWENNMRTPFQTILNGSDKNVFNNMGYQKWKGLEPLKLVTHHWGGNMMKGFDIYSKVDDMLENKFWKSKITFTYVGNLPKGFIFKNVKHVKPLDGLALANELKKHHVYLTASINEPGGNHQNEGGLCGLPILFRNSGSLPEYCKGYGVMFNKKNFEAALYQMMYEYKSYVEKMENYPHDSVLCASKYIKLFRRLSKDLNFIDNNDRFYKHPIKTIKSLFII
jgi:hypothetical protein